MKINSKHIVKKIYKEGFVIIKDFLNPKFCDKIFNYIEKIHQKKNQKKNNFDEGSKYGQIIIRDLVLREPKTFLKFLNFNFINNVLKEIFRDHFILENMMASNSVNVEKNYLRNVHIDSHLPNVNPLYTTDVVVLFCLDNFSQKNGATKIWPRSHLSGLRIHHENKSKLKLYKKYKFAEATRGSIIFFLGQTWHQIGKNENSKSRWGILNHYKRWWIKPGTDFTKCGPKIFKILNKKQKELFGFNCIPPRFNLKTQSRNLKTLRNSKKISLEYFKAIRY